MKSKITITTINCSKEHIESLRNKGYEVIAEYDDELLVKDTLLNIAEDVKQYVIKRKEFKDVWYKEIWYT